MLLYLVWSVCSELSRVKIVLVIQVLALHPMYVFSLLIITKLIQLILLLHWVVDRPILVEHHQTKQILMVIPMSNLRVAQVQVFALQIMIVKLNLDLNSIAQLYHVILEPPITELVWTKKVALKPQFPLVLILACLIANMI